MEFKKRKQEAERKLEYIEKRKKNCLKYAISSLDYYIQNYKKTHPEVKNVSEVKEHLEKYIEDIAQRLVWNGQDYHKIEQPESIMDNAITLQNMRNWLKDSKGYQQKFKEITKKETNSQGEESEEITDNTEIEDMKSLYSYFKEVVKKIKTKEEYYHRILEYIEATKKGQKVVIQTKDKEMFLYMTEIFKQSSEEKQFLKFIEYQEKLTQRVQKESIISALSYMGDVFESFQCLERYQKHHEKQLKRIGLEELVYEMEGDKKNIGIKESFSEDFLQKLSVEQLSILHCVWSNRMAKELEDINHAYFVLCTCHPKKRNI